MNKSVACNYRTFELTFVSDLQRIQNDHTKQSKLE